VKLARLGLLGAVLVALLAGVGLAQADGDTPLTEPKVVVETYPQWREGDLAIFIMDFPQDGATYQRDSIRFRVAVWGATEDRPIVILLDGEEAARIEGEGMFTYEWSLRGSHHLLIRGPTRIFQQAAFNVKSPPPPPPVIQVAEFQARLEEQRSQMMAAMIGATVAGVPAGIGTKKKTKITTPWAAVPFGAAILVGLKWLPDYYMLIPFGLAAALAYWLSRDYAEERGLLSLGENGINVDLMYLDDEGYEIQDISPRWWREGFILRRKVVVEDEYPVLLTAPKLNLVSLCVKEKVEKEDRVVIKCDRALAVTLMVANVVQELSEENARLKARNTILEAMGSAMSAKQITQEVNARMLGLMRGEMGRVNPEAILRAREALNKKADREAKRLE